MFVDGRIFLIRCLSPMHAGIGQEIGSIDMPIQRERTTNLPKIEASTFKGSFRSIFSPSDGDLLFGKSNDDITKQGNAGIIGITDLKLLFYPIKSNEGIYKLVTCPYLLNKLTEDVKMLQKVNSGSIDLNLEFINEEIQSGECLANKSSGNIVELDGYSFMKKEFKDTNIQKLLKKIIETSNIESTKDIVIISNDDFLELEELNREVITRNRIDQNTGVVKGGALFTEEYLPAESILYGIFLYSPFNTETCFCEKLDDNKNVLKKLKSKPIFQVGGNINLGKGIIEMSIISNNKE